jgi:UPF0716 protein FxsA
MPFIFIWLLLEIVVFILVGEAIGALWVVLLIILTTLLGFALMRTETMTVMKKVQAAMRSGRPPMSLGKDTPLKMLAGMLLLIPGFITDAIGLVLLAASFFVKSESTVDAGAANDSGAIDGEFWEEEQKPADLEHQQGDEHKDKE